MPVRICFVTSHLPQGGAERQIVELIKKILKKEFEIYFILYQSDVIFYEELKELKVHFIINERIPSKYVLFRWINNMIFLRKKLKGEAFDVIHTFMFYNGLFVRLIAPKKYRKKIIYSIRNSYEGVKKLYFITDKLLNKWSVNIYNSKKSLFQLYEFPSKNTLKNNLVIYNGYDTKRFNPKNRVSNKSLTFGMVGRMSAQKNQIQLLRVLAKIKTTLNLKFKLYIIGDSSLDQASRITYFIKSNNLEKEVIFMDSQKNIEDYYKRFDLFVLPSFYEGCPNVLFEALLSKCLCIISEGANSDYFIKDGFNGFVYDGSDEMLILKIKYSIDLLKNNASDQIILNGYEYAFNNFSLTKMANSYEKIYKKILNFEKNIQDIIE